MLDNFVNGFEKTAKHSLLGLARRALPYAGVSGAAGVGSYAYGKGRGSEEQLRQDKQVFQDYLDWDISRDTQRSRQVAESAFIQGFNYAKGGKPKSNKSKK